MEAMEYLKRDTWSTLEMEPFELEALADLLDRVEPTTPAETVIRDRVLDAECRRQQALEEATHDDIDMLAVCDRVRAKGYEAKVEHTGGGCATIFAGPMRGDYYAAAAGPGTASDWRAGTIEFFVGPDDGDDMVKVTNPDPEVIATLIVEQIRQTILEWSKT